jgi:hypothetical protein
MKKIFMLSFIIIILMCFNLLNCFADDCSKVIWNVGAVNLTSGDWQDISINHIKIPPKRKGKDLIIDVSLESELKTNTLSLMPSKSEAEVEVMVRVLVEGEIAQPDEVTFARRFQALIHNKPPSSGDPLATEHNAVVVLYTTTANSFNFIAQDVPNGGDLDIVVQAKVASEQITGDQCQMHDQTGVSILKGSVIIECVKMIEDKDVD